MSFRIGGADYSSEMGINQESFKPFVKKQYKVRVTDFCGYEDLNSFESKDEAIRFAQKFNNPIKDIGNNMLMVVIGD